VLSPVSRPATGGIRRQPLEQIKQSESQLSGRVGYVEMDLASGRTLAAWRADERFP
jgi:beta-lactamase class A SHV